MQTTGVCASISARSTGSVSALPPALRVMPNAVSFACLSDSDVFARWKNSTSFGFEPG